MDDELIDLTEMPADEAAAVAAAIRAYRPTAKAAPDERAAMMASQATVESVHKLNTPPDGVDGDAAIRYWLAKADLWWASPELCELVAAVAPSMPDQPLLADDPPTPWGLVFLGSALPAPPGTRSMYDTLADNAILWATWQHPDTGHVTLSMMGMAKSAAWAAQWMETWDLHDPPSVGCSPERPEDEPELVAQRRRMAALWTVIRQERVVEETVHVGDRAARRRAEREGRQLAPVRMLDVRRPKTAGGDGTGTVEWSHRWLVSAHWRNQWLPSRQQHRLQLIMPYIKGPEDKPLVVRDSVRLVK